MHRHTHFPPCTLTALPEQAIQASKLLEIIISDYSRSKCCPLWCLATSEIIILKMCIVYLCTPFAQTWYVMYGFITVILWTSYCTVFSLANETWGNLTPLHSILHQQLLLRSRHASVCFGEWFTGGWDYTFKVGLLASLKWTRSIVLTHFSLCVFDFLLRCTATDRSARAERGDVKSDTLWFLYWYLNSMLNFIPVKMVLLLYENVYETCLIINLMRDKVCKHSTSIKQDPQFSSATHDVTYSN